MLSPTRCLSLHLCDSQLNNAATFVLCFLYCIEDIQLLTHICRMVGPYTVSEDGVLTVMTTKSVGTRGTCNFQLQCKGTLTSALVILVHSHSQPCSYHFLPKPPRHRAQQMFALLTYVLPIRVKYPDCICSPCLFVGVALICST